MYPHRPLCRLTVAAELGDEAMVVVKVVVVVEAMVAGDVNVVIELSGGHRLRTSRTSL